MCVAEISRAKRSSQMSTASIDASLEFTGGTCVLTHEPLDANRIIESVKDDSAGAIAVFIGTTRNSFKGICSLHLTDFVASSPFCYRKGCYAPGVSGLQ